MRTLKNNHVVTPLPPGQVFFKSVKIILGGKGLRRDYNNRLANVSAKTGHFTPACTQLESFTAGTRETSVAHPAHVSHQR